MGARRAEPLGAGLEDEEARLGVHRRRQVRADADGPVAPEALFAVGGGRLGLDWMSEGWGPCFGGGGADAPGALPAQSDRAGKVAWVSGWLDAECCGRLPLPTSVLDAGTLVPQEDLRKGVANTIWMKRVATAFC